jgi:chromosome partitioning protein
MATTIIATIGRKGGITKTTTTINLAAALAQIDHPTEDRKMRVVVVDGDGQGNTSHSMQVKPADAFYALIAEDAEWQDVLIKVPDGFAGPDLELYLLSSSDALRMIESAADTGGRILDRFEELRESGWADFVLIDSSPGINEVNNSWFYVSDYLLLPTLLERPAIENLRDKTFGYVNEVRAAANEAGVKCAQLLGILPQRFEGSAKVQQTNIGWLAGKYHDTVSFVRRSTITPRKMTITRSAPPKLPGRNYYR